MIRFGMSGWRAVIGDQFTFANVRRVSRAVGRIVARREGRPARLAIGYDTRFLSQRCAQEAAVTLAAEQARPYLADVPLPAPVLALATAEQELDGALNITASHHHPQENGLKVSVGQGAPVSREFMDSVESCLESVDGAEAGEAPAPHTLQVGEVYRGRLGAIVDADAIRRAGLRVAFDPRFGTSRGWLEHVLRGLGVEVVTLNDRVDPLFGGGRPACGSQDLAQLARTVTGHGLELGIAVDGGGERFGVVDRDGTWLAPNHGLALLADDLGRTRNWQGGFARTVATTHLLDRVASLHGRELYETGMGFRSFQPLLTEGRVCFAAEEDGGMTVAGHVPEKDGILACLLMVDLIARRGAGLRQHLNGLFGEIGSLWSRFRELPCAPERRAEVLQRLEDAPAKLAGRPLDRVLKLDGMKWIRDDGAWLLAWISDTRPTLRLYAEAADEQTLTRILDAGEAHLSG